MDTDLFIPNTKHQNPNSMYLEFGILKLFGVWDLVIGNYLYLSVLICG
jgi:hypothetical protein